MDFMKKLEKNEKSYTENGAVGYKSTGHKLVDLNFKIPQYRQDIDANLFEKSLAEDEVLTLKWLLYLRDIRQGVGERKSFRHFVKHLCDNHEDLAYRFIAHVDIAEYGRYDDYVWLYMNIKSDKIKNKIGKILVDRLYDDISCKNNDEGNISLLAKWLPSENASSATTRAMATTLRKEVFYMSPRIYRKTLSSLRRYLDVVEVKMSNGEWSDIDYCKVPSKANLLYRNAFNKHDKERRDEFLADLAEGKTEIKAQAMFLHDIVHEYTSNNDNYWNPEYNKDTTLEELWKAQEKVAGFKNTLVVRDGSASMKCDIPNSSATAMDVADALTLYCAENSDGQYHNKFITFSSTPQIVDVNGKDSLADKLTHLHKCDDCSNTDIEAVFDLILETAIKSKATQEDMPKSVLIISDLEYDAVRSDDVWLYDYDHEAIAKEDKVLFDCIAKKYKKSGYKLPKLVFWNVNSRTSTIPLTENENGVILLSGFSKNLMEMVMSSETDPYEALKKVLNSSRYDCISSMYN